MPFARGRTDRLRQCDTEREVVRQMLIDADDAFGDAVGQPPDGGIDIGFGERMSPCVMPGCD